MLVFFARRCACKMLFFPAYGDKRRSDRDAVRRCRLRRPAPSGNSSSNHSGEEETDVDGEQGSLGIRPPIPHQPHPPAISSAGERAMRILGVWAKQQSTFTIGGREKVEFRPSGGVQFILYIGIQKSLYVSIKGMDLKRGVPPCPPPPPLTHTYIYL